MIVQMQKITSINQRITTIDLRKGGLVAENRVVGRELTRIRERIIVRDGAACRKCGKMVGRLEVDHVVPLALGGQESDFNRQLLCYDCHKLKSELERQGREVSL
jgi:5-methylcytosine-specific restriction endonuclease McrA